MTKAGRELCLTSIWRAEEAGQKSKNREFHIYSLSIFLGLDSEEAYLSSDGGGSVEGFFF